VILAVTVYVPALLKQNFCSSAVLSFQDGFAKIRRNLNASNGAALF
jgi:hypothetical protein